MKTFRNAQTCQALARSQAGCSGSQSLLSLKRIFSLLLLIHISLLVAPSGLQALTFEEWRDSHFDANNYYNERLDMLFSGPNADPDGDGLSNLMEFALGTDPLATSLSDGPSTVIENNAITMSFPKWKNAGELTYIPQVSADLLSWNDGSNFIDTISITDHTAWEMIKVRDKAQMPTAARRFMRLAIIADYIDSDGDELPDWWENNFFGGLSYGPADNYDYDGLTNAEEFANDTNPWDWDTDGDGLSDGDEVHTYHTNPTKADTDGDGMPDNWEIQYGFNPLDASDGQGDFDNDGLSNVEEFNHGLLPNVPDFDNDGLPDGWEVKYGTNPKVADSNLDPDHDGLTNAEEYAANSDPSKTDTDWDGLSDYREVKIYHTKANKKDSDNDGLPDGWEVEHGTNPMLFDSNLDLDGDGLNNFQEWQLGTDPKKADSDDDGIGDGAENDTNRLLGDSDGDLMPDGWELLKGTNPMSDNSMEDPDGDLMGRSLEHMAGRSSSLADSPVDSSNRALDVFTLHRR